MNVLRGDIWWVDFGTPRGSEQGGRRPALIIQNNVGNTSSSTTIIAAITSKKKGPYSFHVDISAAESGLPHDSTILFEQLLTISQSRLISKAGSLSPIKVREIDMALKISLGIIPL